MQDLSHLHIWGCKAFVYILLEQRVKSQKKAVLSQKSFLISCEPQNFYKIFMKKMGKIEKLRDIKFIEDDQSLAKYLADKRFFYYPNFTSKKENKQLSIEVNNLSNSKNKLSLVHSNTETSLHYSIRLQYGLDKYNIIVKHLAMSTLISEVIYELFTHNQALHFPKSTKFQDAIQEDYNAFVKNHILDIVFVPDNQKMLKVKWLYKLKMSSKGTISRYKIRQVAKKFEQQKNIDYAKTFSLIA